MDSADAWTWIAIGSAFLIGGLLKGFAGLGLPMVTVSILSVVFDLRSAMALMLVPGLATNAYQAAVGGHLMEAVRVSWHFQLACLASVWIGTAALVAIEASRIIAVLGVVLCVAALTAIAGFRPRVPKQYRGWSGWVAGLVNGLAAGMTGITSVPSVIWLNGIGLSRPAFIQAMGLLFGLTYGVLALAFWWRGLLEFEAGGLSLFALLPAIVGMMLGATLRTRLSDVAFRWAFDRVLLLVGAYLLARGIAG